MKQLFLDIETKIKAVATEITFVQPFNDQFNQMEQGENGMLVYDFPLPAAFIEFQDPIEWHQMGDNIQIADPLIVRIHLAVEKLNDLSGNMERNLEVYDLARKLFKGLSLWEPAGAVAFVRSGHVHDINHTNLYHFIQEYRTSYVDNYAQKSTDGVEKDPPTTLVVNASYSQKPYTR